MRRRGADWGAGEGAGLGGGLCQAPSVTLSEFLGGAAGGNLRAGMLGASTWCSTPSSCLSFPHLVSRNLHLPSSLAHLRLSSLLLLP